MGMGGQRHATAALWSGKTRYPLYRRLGGPQSRSEQVRKISPSTGILSPDRPNRSVVAIPTMLSRRPSSLCQSFRYHSTCVSYSFVPLSPTMCCLSNWCTTARWMWTAVLLGGGGKVVMKFNPNIKYNKDRLQRTYNITLGHVRATFVVVESDEYYTIRVCVFRLRYSACNVHAPYCHLCSAPL